ncbi:MAG: response regulator [Acidimicrobiales bacterium]|nr:response regulator [Acidimicrobiales bacterium]
MSPATDEIRVFAIDDHPHVLASVALVVAACEGFRDVGAAPDGETAIELIGADDGPDPDLILIDLHMPGCDGLETARALAAGGTDAVLVLMSTADRDALPDGALRPPLHAFLPKAELSTDSLREAWTGVVGPDRRR